MKKQVSPAFKLLPDDFISNCIPVDLVGCGGTGSAVFSLLFKMHSTLINLGHAGLMVRVFDDDTVSPSNIGRQNFWPNDVGRNKAICSVERMNLFGGTNWEAIPERYHAWQNYDPILLITAVDNAKTRCEIGKSAKFLRGAWLDVGSDQRDGQIIMGHLGDRKKQGYIPNVFDLYGKQLTQLAKKPAQAPSCSTAESLQRQDLLVNNALAVHAITLIWNALRHGENAVQGGFLDLQSQSYSPLTLSADTWAQFGYVARAA